MAHDREMTDAERTLLRQLRTVGDTMPTLMRMEKMALLRQLAQQRHDHHDAHRYAKRMVNFLTPSRIASVTELPERIRAVITLRDAYTYMARDDFHSFLVAMEWNREPKKRFYEPRISVFREIVADLQDLADGVIDVYGLSMPPRVGKTTLGLLYICWLAGRDVERSVLSAGYSSSLVQSFYDGCLEFLSGSDYRYHDIFPKSTVVATSAKGLTIDLGKACRYKSLTYRSIDGTVTGATEANLLLYLDDLVSGIQEAMNIIRMDTLWSKVSSDMLQRMKEGCPMLLIGTRWSIHDPMGRIERKYEGNPRARFKRLPATDEKGHSNFNYDHGVGFGDDYYADKKDMLDSVTWECVFQQNPIERDGLLYPELKRFMELPQDRPDDIFAFVDVAFGGEDYVSMPVAYQWGDDVYIEDAVYLRGGYETTEAVVAGMIKRHNISRVVFEANNGGDFYARDVMDMLKKENVHCNIVAMRAMGKDGKLSRIIQHAPEVKSWYFKDHSMYRADSMYGMFMTALTSFVQTGKNRNDDAPDSCAGLANMRRRFTMRRPEFLDRKATGL